MARVLVVDDESSVRRLLRIVLERNGHDVDEAIDGNAAMKRIRTDPPDLIITDLIMPEKEGIETIMELRRDFPNLKIIAISGGGVIGALDYLKMATIVGAHRTFEKPFQMGELLQAVRELLE